MEVQEIHDAIDRLRLDAAEWMQAYKNESRKLEKLQRLHNALQESYDQVYDERDLLRDTLEAVDIIRGRERKIVQDMKDEGDDLTTPYAPC